MTDQYFIENQTVFAEEEPYHIANQKKKKLDETLAVKKPRKLLYLGGAFALVFFLLIGVAATLMKQQSTPSVLVVTPTATPLPQSTSQIDQVMSELRMTVDNADPSKTTLPFPPVADQIHINQ
ncbi:MAG: hypothetical protein ABI425_01360 [Patescibacteria group bacterium]